MQLFINPESNSKRFRKSVPDIKDQWPLIVIRLIIKQSLSNLAVSCHGKMPVIEVNWLELVSEWRFKTGSPFPREVIHSGICNISVTFKNCDKNCDVPAWRKEKSSQ